MAAKGVVYVVFLLPIIFSVVFGTLVMAQALQDPTRELNMLQFSSDSFVVSSNDVEILGLEKQYSKSTPIEISISIDDPGFDCGDLYITIYDIGSLSKEVVTQSGYFDQCFVKNNSKLPMGDKFSEIVDSAGNYEISIQMVDKNGKNFISSKENFSVK